MSLEQPAQSLSADDFELKIKLPRGDFTFAVQDFDAVPDLRQRVPDAKPNSSAIHVGSHIPELLEVRVCIEAALELVQHSVVIQLDLVAGRRAKYAQEVPGGREISVPL
ncbi:hypothetical protein V2G26_013172 [Clonostachys chloroleuca]